MCSDLICPYKNKKLGVNHWMFFRYSFYELYCDAILTGEIDMKAFVDNCKPIRNITEICPVQKIETSETVFEKCDMFCQKSGNCIDEAVCNGFQYGIFCEKNSSKVYIKSTRICDGIIDCDDLSDEISCNRGQMDEKNHNNCVNNNVEVLLFEIFNFTRCGPLEMTPTQYFSYCEDFADQTNCSDSLRGVLRCKVDGHDSTISSAVLCKGIRTFCDDGIDEKCEFTSHSCNVHKHLLCNSIKDCNDGSDELGSMCKSLLLAKCHRRYLLFLKCCFQITPIFETQKILLKYAHK